MDSIIPYIGDCFSIIWSKCVFYFNYWDGLAGAIGYIGGSFGFTGLSKKTYEGFTGMTDIFFIDAYRRFSCDGGKAGVSIIYCTKLKTY
jgi:hypothetical protein